MSIPVPLPRLRAAVEERAPGAYLLTVSDDGWPHAVHAPVRWEDDAIVVDGTAAVESSDDRRRVRVVPVRAVLHRPAAVPDPSKLP